MSKKAFGLINVNEAYSKSMVLERLGISQKFWDQMLDSGLSFTHVGHARWVTGRELIRYLENHSQQKRNQAS